MIPKVIHYCWFGRGPKPRLAKKCIKSWQKYLPGYDIKEWNEDNFNISIIPYVKDAYEAKKYAFVSDYARFWILYHYGGLYFDTDVEIIQSMDGIVNNGPFMGCEEDSVLDINSGQYTFPAIAPGLCLGSMPNLPLFGEVLDYYSNCSFKKEDGTLNMKTVVRITTEIMIKHGLQKVNTIQRCAEVTIYPKEYFCPLSYKTGDFNKTDKTVSIHHYAASWLPWDKQLNIKYAKIRLKYPRLFYYCIYIPHYLWNKYYT